jgi:trigger factor
MKTQVEKGNGLTRKLNIEVPAATVKSAFNRVFENIQKDVEIKGFRKGKAPLATIKTMYGDRVKQDVVQELIQMHYPKALSEHKLEPIGYPDFEFDDVKESADFSFTASFDVKPEITLKKYEGLDVEKEKSDVDDKKIDQVLENIRNSRASNEDVLIARPAQNGDIAVVDFEGFVNNQPLENGTGKNHNLELGANQFIAGFEEGVVGMNIGENRTLSLKFPDPYHAAELAGQPVQFKVTLVGLKKRVLPELNDEFIKSLGGPANLDELKKTIREDMEKSEQKRIDDALKNNLLKKLVDANPVEVPASLLKEQKQSLIADFQKRMTEQGMSQKDFEDYVQKWDKDFETTASEMIQSSFLIDEIARKHELVATREDVDHKLVEYAGQTGIEETKLREFYARPESASRLAYMITEDKVIQHLLKSAKVKEVPKQNPAPGQ